MTITVRHRTTYTFDAPVFLEPHVIRLHPRAGAAARLVDFGLDIEPAPAVRAENLDLDGNVVTHAWFEGLTAALAVRTHATVETSNTDPFGFLAVDADRSLPYAYAPDLAHRLRPCRSAPDAAHPAVRELAVDVARESSRNPLSFPLDLARRLHGQFALERRPGRTAPGHRTKRRRAGAGRAATSPCCSSTAAARWGSPHASSAATRTRTAQAPTTCTPWAEVYLVGGGWRAYDPSYGVAVADRHVTVAAAPEAGDAAPITGSFRGDSTARLQVEVRVQAGSTAAPPA